MEECKLGKKAIKDDVKCNPESSRAISSLLIKVENCQDSLQNNFANDSKLDLVNVTCPTTDVVSVSVTKSDSSLSMSLTDADILLETGDAIQHVLDTGSNTIQLDHNTHSFVQTLTVADESDSCDAPTEFIDGQAVRLEDGTTAFIHSVPREGLQPVQLEDGTMVYLSRTRDELFNGEASGLDLEHLSPQITPDMDNASDKEDGKSVTLDKNLKVSRVASGDKSFRCPYKNCNRVYTTPHHLKVHERSHTGDRPFKCSVTGCGKAFATGYGLKSHTRVHTGETPYKCHTLNCMKAFKTSGDLQKHLRTHTGERPFKCSHAGCDRAFTTSNIRKVHMRTHTGERPYNCDVCGRAFASATNFKNHVRIHTGEKPYICNFQGCNKKFTEYSSLYKHNVVHTRDKPYICTLCGKHYRQTSTLASHKRTAHDIVDVGEENFKTVVLPNSSSLNKDESCVKASNVFELNLETDLAEATNVLIAKTESQENIESDSKKLSTVITLHGDEASNVLTEHPAYAIQFHQDGTISSTQQILLVTDPSQIAALQQLSQVQIQLQNVISDVDSPIKES